MTSYRVYTISTILLLEGYFGQPPAIFQPFPPTRRMPRIIESSRSFGRVHYCSIVMPHSATDVTGAIFINRAIQALCADRRAAQCRRKVGKVGIVSTT